MPRSTPRLASAVIGAITGATVGLLVFAAPAGATEIRPSAPGAVPVSVQLPPLMPCSTPWTTVIIGTPGHDELVGTDGPDLIIGLGGDDTLVGGLGRDTLIGGDGADLLVGGPQNDCVLGGAGADESVIFAYTQPNGTDVDESVTYRYEY